ncbi:hypothetical protein [Caulobacter segnis]
MAKAQEFKDSRSAKGVRMVKAVSAVVESYNAVGNADAAERVRKLLDLPFGSLVTLAEAFETVEVA